MKKFSKIRKLFIYALITKGNGNTHIEISPFCWFRSRFSGLTKRSAWFVPVPCVSIDMIRAVKAASTRFSVEGVRISKKHRKYKLIVNLELMQKVFRSRQDSNLRGETPLDFKSNALTTRPRLLLEKPGQNWCTEYQVESPCMYVAHYVNFCGNI